MESSIAIDNYIHEWFDQINDNNKSKNKENEKYVNRKIFEEHLIAVNIPSKTLAYILSNFLNNKPKIIYRHQLQSFIEYNITSINQCKSDDIRRDTDGDILHMINLNDDNLPDYIKSQFPYELKKKSFETFKKYFYELSTIKQDRILHYCYNLKLQTIPYLLRDRGFDTLAQLNITIENVSDIKLTNENIISELSNLSLAEKADICNKIYNITKKSIHPFMALMTKLLHITNMSIHDPIISIFDAALRNKFLLSEKTMLKLLKADTILKMGNYNSKFNFNSDLMNKIFQTAITEKTKIIYKPLLDYINKYRDGDNAIKLSKQIITSNDDYIKKLINDSLPIVAKYSQSIEATIAYILGVNLDLIDFQYKRIEFPPYDFLLQLIIPPKNYIQNTIYIPTRLYINRLVNIGKIKKPTLKLLKRKYIKYDITINDILSDDIMHSYINEKLTTYYTNQPLYLVEMAKRVNNVDYLTIIEDVKYLYTPRHYHHVNKLVLDSTTKDAIIKITSFKEFISVSQIKYLRNTIIDSLRGLFFNPDATTGNLYTTTSSIVTTLLSLPTITDIIHERFSENNNYDKTLLLKEIIDYSKRPISYKQFIDNKTISLVSALEMKLFNTSINNIDIYLSLCVRFIAIVALKEHLRLFYSQGDNHRFLLLCDEIDNYLTKPPLSIIAYEYSHKLTELSDWLIDQKKIIKSLLESDNKRVKHVVVINPYAVDEKKWLNSLNQKTIDISTAPPHFSFDKDEKLYILNLDGTLELKLKTTANELYKIQNNTLYKRNNLDGYDMIYDNKYNILNYYTLDCTNLFMYTMDYELKYMTKSGFKLLLTNVDSLYFAYYDAIIHNNTGYHYIYISNDRLGIMELKNIDKSEPIVTKNKYISCVINKNRFILHDYLKYIKLYNKLHNEQLSDPTLIQREIVDMNDKLDSNIIKDFGFEIKKIGLAKDKRVAITLNNEITFDFDKLLKECKCNNYSNLNNLIIVEPILLTVDENEEIDTVIKKTKKLRKGFTYKLRPGFKDHELYNYLKSKIILDNKTYITKKNYLFQSLINSVI